MNFKNQNIKYLRMELASLAFLGDGLRWAGGVGPIDLASEFFLAQLFFGVAKAPLIGL
jgi:hypothetical protein